MHSIQHISCNGDVFTIFLPCFQSINPNNETCLVTCAVSLTCLHGFYMHDFSFDPPLNQDTSVHILLYGLHTRIVNLLCIVPCIDTDTEKVEEFLASNKHVVQMWGAGKEVQLNMLQQTALKEAMVNRFQLIQGPPGVYCRLLCILDRNVCTLYPNCMM